MYDHLQLLLFQRPLISDKHAEQPRIYDADAEADACRLCYSKSAQFTKPDAKCSVGHSCSVQADLIELRSIYHE